MTQHYTLASFQSSQCIPYLLKQTHELMHSCAQEAYLSGGDLSFTQFLVLLKLKEGIATTPSSLCRLMYHDTGAFTRLLDQLEERGFVLRTRAPSDRRMIVLKLTPAGEAKLAELMPMLVDMLNVALTDFSPKEFSELTRLLNKLRNSVLVAREQLASDSSAGNSVAGNSMRGAE